MNILFLTTHLNAGGITSYLFTLSKGLVRKGHTVHLASAGGNRQDAFHQAGVRTVFVDFRTKSELSPKIYFSLSRLKTYVRDHHIDVVHSHTRVTQVAGRLLKMFSGVAYVSTCHGFFRPHWFRKRLGAWGDRVIAISPQVQDHLMKDFSVAEDRIALVESGIDLEMFQPADEAVKKSIRAKLGYGEEILIGIIARFSDVKGQDLLVIAMKDVIRACPQARLLLIGSGKQEELLRGLTKELGLQAHVRFHPVVAQTAEMLSALDIVVSPSRNEGLGLSIMEAQAMALPVVGTRVGGIPSLIKDGETGLLIEPEAPPAIAASVVRLCRDPGLRLRLGQSARRFAVDRCSSDGMVDKTVACYRSVAHGN